MNVIAQQQGGMGWQTIVMMVLLLVFAYLMLFRPEQKRRKKLQEMRASLKIGDRITAMGIVGTIDSLREETIVVNTGNGTKLEMLKAAITEVHPAEKPEETTAD